MYKGTVIISFPDIPNIILKKLYHIVSDIKTNTIGKNSINSPLKKLSFKTKTANIGVKIRLIMSFSVSEDNKFVRFAIIGIIII